MTSKLESIVLEYPSAPWNWNALSGNSAISVKFILNNPTMPWVSKYVSQKASEEDIMQHLDYGWSLESLCSNPNLSLSFFLKYIINPVEVLRVDWHLLSSNPAITLFDIIQNPQYPWKDRYLSANPNMTSSYILNEGINRNWFIPSICSNPGITANDIFKNTLSSLLKDGWDYKNLSANRNLPIAFVIKHLDKDWNYHTISTNASMTDIITYRKIKWDGHGLSMNTNITFDFVKQNPNLGWDAPMLLANSSISQKTILDNSDWFQPRMKEPFAKYMSANASITSQWIKKNRLSIDWNALSMNQMY